MAWTRPLPIADPAVLELSEVEIMTDDYRLQTPHHQLQTEQAKRIVTFDLEGILILHTVLKLLWKKCLFRFEDVSCSLMH